MKRFWYLRDLEGMHSDQCYLYVAEEPPKLDDEGEWVDGEDPDGTFIEEGEIEQYYGNVNLPRLKKGERIEMKLILEVK